MPLDEGLETARCQRLWKAVILQAVTDLRYSGSNAQLTREKLLTSAWASPSNPDFRTVCDLADFHPDWLRRQIDLSAQRRTTWRAAPGTGRRYLERRKYRARLAATQISQPANLKGILPC